ncbi:hypothetical protein PG990_003169 [Apiospora arundinis]
MHYGFYQGDLKDPLAEHPFNKVLSDGDWNQLVAMYPRKRTYKTSSAKSSREKIEPLKKRSGLANFLLGGHRLRDRWNVF